MPYARDERYFSFAPIPGSIDVLDGLRAIAVMLVMLRHGVRPFWDQSGGMLLPVASWDASSFMINGWVGVDLFFILSGFLITHHIVKQQERNDGSGFSWNGYLTRRIFRIVPAYYVMLLLVCLGVFPGYVIDQDYLSFRIFYHLLFLQDVLPSNINVVFWSLGVEEKFYLLAPFIVLGALSTTRRRLRYGLLAFLYLAPLVVRLLTLQDVISYEQFFLADRSPFYVSIDGLIAGVICAFVYQDARIWRAELRKRIGTAATMIGLVLLLAMIVPAVLIDRGAGVWAQSGMQNAINLSFAAITLGLLLYRPSATLLPRAISLVGARLSYALYLVHLPLIPVSMMMTEWLAGLHAPQPAFLLFLPIYLGMSLAAALVLHFLVEKPFLLIKDSHVLPWLQRPAPIV